LYEGFLSLGGIEIGNADRVQSYARNRGFHALRQDPLHDGLHVALEEEPYTSPLLDDAPWVDERDPATHKFLGILPISIKGVSDSTRTAEVTESIVEGGTVGDGRAATREMRYTGMVVAEDDLGAEAGLSWLRKIAEGDQCGMHEACGMSDLTFFLDKPEVCASLYSKRIDWAKAQAVNTGSISPGADLIYRFAATRDIEQPIRGAWAVNAGQGDGVELSWGLLDIDSGDVLEEVEKPLLLQRTNLLSNPSFTAGLNGVSVTAGTAALSRETAFGVDGGAHARMSPTDGSSVRTNWVPDPRFTLDSAASPWRTNGRFTAVADGGPIGLPYGGFVRTDFEAPLYAEFSAQGPVRESGAPMLSTLSVYVATSSSTQVEITVTDNFGAQTSVARQAVDANAGYTRLVAQLSVGKSYVVRISAPVASMSVGGALLEGGAVLGDYFDGSDAYDGVFPGKVIHAWTGTPNGSPSTRQTGAKVVTNTVPNPDMNPAGPMPVNAYRAKVSPASGVGLGVTADAALVEQDYATALSPYYASPAGTSSPAAPDQKWQQRARVRPSWTSFGARTYEMQCRFFDSTSAQIGTETAYSTRVKTAPIGTFHRWTGAAGASTSERYQGETKRSNLATDPRALLTSIGTALRGFQARWFGGGNNNGTITARTAQSDGPTPHLTSYLEKVWTVVDNGGSSNLFDVAFSHMNNGNGGMPVKPGQVFTLSSYFWSNVPVNYGGDGGARRMTVAFFDQSGALIYNVFGPNVPVFGANTWVRLASTVTAPAGAAYMAAWQDIYMTGVAGTVVKATGLMIEEAGVLGAYLDGDTIVPISGVRYAWLGPVNGSPSVRDDSAGRRVNRAPNPVNGTSLSAIGGSRADVSLGADFVRATITDATVGSNAQRIVIGATAGQWAMRVFPGEVVPFSIELRSSTAQPMSIFAYWYDRDGTYLSITPFTTTAATNAATFTRHQVSVTAPARAVTMLVYVGTGLGARAVGDTFDARRLMVGDTGDYFDGSMASTAVLPTGVAPAVDVSLQATAPAGTASTRAYLQATVAGRDGVTDGFYLDDWLYAQDDGVALTPYFSGATASTATQTGEAFYLLGDASSASRLISGTRTASTLEVSPVVGVYGPMVASLAVRSRESAEITASMVSTDDGTVLATRTFVGGEVWERISLVTQFGRSVRLRVVAKGRVDLDQMLVENASVVYDYFDGDSVIAPRPDLLNLAADLGIKQEYSTRWTSTPYASPSKTTWQGGLYVSHEDGRARPFLRAVQGRLPSTQFTWVPLTEITMDEQLDPYQRSFHGVSVVEGPTEIERMRVSGGVAVRFSMLLVAENPAMLGRRIKAEMDERWWLRGLGLYASPQLVSRNYAANPINISSTYSPVPANSVGSVVSDVYLRIPGLSQLGTRLRRITRSTATAGDDQVAQSSFTETTVPGFHASVWVRASTDRSMFISALLEDNIGILPDVTNTITVKKGVWTKLSITTQNSQGVLSGTVRFGSASTSAAAGDYYEYTALFLTRGTFPTDPDFFHGSMLETPTYSYSWLSTSNNSASVRTERTKIGARSLVDPTLPAQPTPPKPPVVGAIFPETQVWTRGRAQIPADLVETWALAVPTVTVRTITGASVRNLRLRFYANPFGYAPADVDPESYCGEMLITYIPLDTTFVLDGVTRSATAQIQANAPIPADQNVISSTGGPVNWPELTCGVPYVVTAEFPQGSGESNMGWIADIQVELTRKE